MQNSKALIDPQRLLPLRNFFTCEYDEHHSMIMLYYMAKEILNFRFKVTNQ